MIALFIKDFNMNDNFECKRECESKDEQICWLCPEVKQTEDIFNEALMSKFWRDALDN